MRKLILLGLMILMPALSRATVLGYWRGETSPGRLVDSSGTGHDLTQTFNPGNPTSPAPQEGTKWLGGTTGGWTGNDRYNVPIVCVPLGAGGYVFEFWTRVDVIGDQQSILALEIIYNTPSALEDYFVEVNSGVPRLRIFNNNGGFIVTRTFTDGVNHLIRVERPTNGLNVKVYIDSVLTDTVANCGLDLSTASIPVVPTLWRNYNNTPSSVYVDAVMLASAQADVYPGPAVPTPTPTPTITQTFTSSPTPTITQTFTSSPTPTITQTFTSTFTATPTFTVTPSITKTSTSTPTFTATPTATRTTIPTPGITAPTKLQVLQTSWSQAAVYLRWKNGLGSSPVTTKLYRDGVLVATSSSPAKLTHQPLNTLLNYTAKTFDAQGRLSGDSNQVSCIICRNSALCPSPTPTPGI